MAHAPTVSRAASERLQFYYFPRACSLAPHIVLEETALAYDRVLVDIRPGEPRNPAYLDLNPSGTVPALKIGSRLLTETHAILTWLADRCPELALLPAVGDPARYHAHEWMNFLSSAVHPAIRAIFRPSAYAGEDAAACDAVREHALGKLARAVATVEHRLGSGDWALGSRYSVVDAYLFIMYLWTTDERISAVPSRPRWDGVAARVWQRPATQRVVAIERQDRAYSVPSHWLP